MDIFGVGCLNDEKSVLTPWNDREKLAAGKKRTFGLRLNAVDNRNVKVTI